MCASCSNDLFAELIGIVCGHQESISHAYSDSDWNATLGLAKKQALTGVCFLALQSLEPFLCPSKEVCRKWLNAAEPVRKRNAMMTERSIELDQILRGQGFRPCILKGQTFMEYYGDYGTYRESGDIDVWIDTSLGEIDSFVSSMGIRGKKTYAHVECDFFTDTIVEIHPRPAFMVCPCNNRRLQRWFESFDVDRFDRSAGFTVAPVEFNAVYLLVHLLHHFLTEGSGLRQLMDYYFVIKSAEIRKIKADCVEIVESLHMTRFARGIMWIMQEVFGLEDDNLIWEADARVGRFLLDEAMAGGNFGNFDKRDRMVKSSNPFKRFVGGMLRDSRYLCIAPSEVICIPFWRMWHFCWTRINS